MASIRARRGSPSGRWSVPRSSAGTSWVERLERYGLNYVDFGVADVEMLAPLVALLGEGGMPR
jgi:hypothetical protein